MKRRTFLEVAGLAGSGLLVPGWSRAQGGPGSNPLAIPALLGGEMENGRRHCL
jgi:hypothetical protein